MRIVFVICSFGHGKGGHFHSLRVIAEALQNRADCMILNIGLKPSGVLAESNVDFVFEEFDGWHPLRCARNILAKVSKFKPDVVHSFDMPSHFWARLLGRRLGLPVVHTKCGGPDPKRYYPHASSLIAFSAENAKYFRASRKYSGSRIEHIPNRSTAVQPDLRRIRRLSEIADNVRPKIMRVARFSPAYKNSLLQAMDFVTALNSESSTKYQLILIGAIQDDAVFEAVRANASDDVLIVTDEYFTRNASELIGFADAVIATGRGTMEAASLEKIIFIPSDSGDIPVLLTKHNFNELFEKNFSPRVNPDNRSDLKSVAAVMDHSVKRKELETQAKLYFEEYFLIDNAVGRYMSIYSTAKIARKRRIIDALLNFGSMERSFLGASRAKAGNQ